ncbi:hypothetical protein Nstercoris_01471 [Nitrosomonas stercoris]|uniref:Uncharacterized protein n=1 Tax=Nitrosomonas stercoris TaxID=1444684 RepID=A0A4Y1YNE5_9PROT|nr:hypothetical protein Nstercoris_01471 [Nitrosomonas stercoris]
MFAQRAIDTSNLYSSKERRSVFSISCSNATPSFEMQKSILDKMPQFIQFFIIRSLYLSVFLRRNNHFHSLFFCLFNNGVTIIATICQQIMRIYSCDQVASLRAISSGTLCSKDSDRHTMRIHGQMYLGVEPPFI